VPETWQWRLLSDIADVRGGVTKGRRFNGRRTVQLPYLRVANVQDGYLDLREIKLIDALPADRAKYALRAGDILFTEGGDRDKLGRGTVWRGEIEGCIHQNHIFRARPTTGTALADYVSLATKSDYSRRYFFENASQTVNLASINLTVLSALPIALPPVSEQDEIIRRVQKLLGWADQLEKRVARVGLLVDGLRPSLLVKAFEGELVPTEADLAAAEGRDYETASALLERIHQRQPSTSAGRGLR
jgi:type I restriction enzyme S subunit